MTNEKPDDAENSNKMGESNKTPNGSSVFRQHMCNLSRCPTRKLKKARYFYNKLNIITDNANVHGKRVADVTIKQNKFLYQFYCRVDCHQQ
jgi:hypothetical protein